MLEILETGSDAVVPNLANELGEDYELKIIGDGFGAWR